MLFPTFAKMKGRIFFFLGIAVAFFWISSFRSVSHPYYVSVTEIRITSEKRTMSLSCKMFTDDLQDALASLYKLPADLAKRNIQCDSLINLYVQQRMRIEIGAENVEYKFIGYEIEEEAVWCYFESSFSSAGKQINVRSSILYDFLETQANFIHCYYDGERKSFKLVNPAQEASFDFDKK